MFSKTNPPITIITVVKDDFTGFMTTAKSVLGQDSELFEWVVVVGDSGEEILSFLDSIPPSIRIRRFILAPNGIYNAMNFGAEQARGSWLWYLNAGDFLISPESVTNMAALIQGSSNKMVVATAVAYVTPLGYLYDFTRASVETNDSYKIARINHQGCAIRKADFLVLGGFDEELRYAADGKLLDSLIKDTSPIITNHVFVAFTMGGLSTMNFRDTLIEIQSYRPSKRSFFLERRRLLLATQFRKYLIKHEATGRFARQYLSNREKKKILISSEQLNLGSHWVKHDQSKASFYNCCIS
jgi:glycosyltransferase involved in cell wall biosynthesis